VPQVAEAKEKSRTVRYPAPLDAWIEKQAKERGVTVSEYLRHIALKEYDAKE
jgi:hypothetical protein